MSTVNRFKLLNAIIKFQIDVNLDTLKYRPKYFVVIIIITMKLYTYYRNIFLAVLLAFHVVMNKYFASII